MGTHTFLGCALFLLAACNGPRLAQQTNAGSSAPLPPPMLWPPPPALTVIGDLRAPESVLYDASQDVYFISNINGELLGVDNNGFISRVDPNTFKVDLQWISGGKNGVKLDAPKGMGIVGDTLYVSDVTAVRKFDKRTGAPQGEIALPGATLINDITTDGKSIYVSDTGLQTGAGKTFLATGSDAIWKITNDRAEKIASGKELGHPNGLDWADGTLRVATFGRAELYELDGGKPKRIADLPTPELDGLTHLADGSILVSSWKGHEVFRGPAKGPFQAILAGLNAPADIGYDTKRHRLLLPISGANQVTIHAVQ